MQVALKPYVSLLAHYYYSARRSIFTSVDPMWAKYPNISPYAYCANNPIMFVDPDGNIPWPVENKYKGATRYIISGFYRNNPPNRFHGGVDIVHNLSKGVNISGGDIISTHSGKVTTSGYSKTAGNWVVVTNGNIRTKYMHMKEKSKLKVGQDIEEGTFIGNIGTTGRSEGNHLHYQLERYDEDKKQWEKINPVVGGQLHVNKEDVDLIDPQQIINEINKQQDSRNSIPNNKENAKQNM